MNYLRDIVPLTGGELLKAKEVITSNHYAHSIPSGKSYYFRIDSAYIGYSIPANRNVGNYITGHPDWPVWELSRLWAPDGHMPNLLTQAIALSIKALSKTTPLAAVVSYADPNVGHTGGIYRAASWAYLGQCEESRYYRKGNQVVARRKFHSGRRSLTKAEILNLGYTEEKLPGKYRFARGLTHPARRAIKSRSQPLPLDSIRERKAS